MSSQTTLITSRDRKGLSFIQKVEAAYNNAGLDDERAQRLNESPEVIPELRKLIERYSAINQFADEEVASNYGYLSGYRTPISVQEQIDILRRHWPQLHPDKALVYARDVCLRLQLPDWIEGPFVRIRPGFFSNVYGEELEEVLKALSKDRDRKFVNYREGQLGPDRLRQSMRSTAAMGRILKWQPDSDLLIVPGQFGIRYAGCSVRRVREKYVSGEFGSGAVDGATMLLTHPIRLKHYDDLWIDLGGDEYHDPDDDEPFSKAPCFEFLDGWLKFDTEWSDFAHDSFGSASLFSLQEIEA